jgi:hypothetical protein
MKLELRTSLWRCGCQEPSVRSSDIFSKAVFPTHPTDLSLPAPPISYCNVFHATNKLTEPLVPNCYLYAPNTTPKTSYGFCIYWYFGCCLSFQYFSQTTTFRKYIELCRSLKIYAYILQTYGLFWKLFIQKLKSRLMLIKTTVCNVVFT